ncbi:hypothetical protein LF1_20240 [Rubripirellula obstinata]|uniref:Uncharacterized protein n=1 Tax=Rubripirellula obstinata TaxID=406547 RepID=A0A5B1CIQ6_9BACT|nr:hypothetical protein LF1_20240 [Rubripirellula obstinata]
MERVTAGLQSRTANHGLTPGGPSYKKTEKLFHDSSHLRGSLQKNVVPRSLATSCGCWNTSGTLNSDRTLALQQRRDAPIRHLIEEQEWFKSADLGRTDGALPGRRRRTLFSKPAFRILASLRTFSIPSPRIRRTSSFGADRKLFHGSPSDFKPDLLRRH